MSEENNQEKEKFCLHCGKLLVRKTAADGFPERLKAWKKRQHCGMMCANQKQKRVVKHKSGISRDWKDKSTVHYYIGSC